MSGFTPFIILVLVFSWLSSFRFSRRSLPCVCDVLLVRRDVAAMQHGRLSKKWMGVFVLRRCLSPWRCGLRPATGADDYIPEASNGVIEIDFRGAHEQWAVEVRDMVMDDAPNSLGVRMEQLQCRGPQLLHEALLNADVGELFVLPGAGTCSPSHGD